ncbi:MAG: hypothetical protein ACTSUS_10290 [Candidatus Freyarchaeota archaeon]
MRAEPLDVGFRGYPESPIRGPCPDDGETPDRPKHTLPIKAYQA